MGEKHQRIVEEITEKYKDKEKVIAINVIGSVGRGEEKPSSDVDIEVVKEKEKIEWEWKKKEKYGIHIDFIESTKAHYKNVLNNYPYLAYIDLDKKPVYDPENFMSKTQEKIKKYMKNNPEVQKFWTKKFNQMKKDKKKNNKKENLKEIFNKAEKKFSKDNKITRNWFRKK